MFTRLGAKAYKADLKNTIALCKFLGNPEKKIKTLHIAGTNGKGSTSHILAAIFQQNGYKTGLYTSPHLKDFRERIKINGEMISEDFVVKFIKKTKDFSDEINPSFFELTFVMSLEYFAQSDVDVAVIETGLGGRLDSTNVITPEISIITNIGFDHTDILGDTLEKIAFEKAGIIKEKVPAVIGQTTPETKKVFLDKAKETNAPIYFAQEKYEVISASFENEKLRLEINEIEKKSLAVYLLDLPGLYQASNFLTVLTATHVLKQKYSLSDKNIREAISHVKKMTGLHGRWEIIHRKPLVVLDVAHNVDGIQQLVNQIKTSSYKNLHIIFGMVKDKEIEKVLDILPKNALYYFTKAQIPRALPENELLEKAQKYQLAGNTFNEVNEALQAAINNASQEDMIIVCGSVFLVGEVNTI